MRIRRRQLLRSGAVGAAGAAVPLSFSQLFTRRATAEVYGPLERDPAGVLDLPQGFTYRILERYGSEMDDGFRVPGRPDAMACFEARGQWALMRNHELSDHSRAQGPYRPGQPPPAEAYTSEAMGGVSRVVVDPHTLERVSSNLVLAGTRRNCAGGPSPWGWLSCEESVAPGHGFVFLTRADAGQLAPARRIDGYGRFNHEAVAIDPSTQIAYLTEDRGDSAFYRFVPRAIDAPFSGRLQALRHPTRPGLDTGLELEVGQRIQVDWVDIEAPTPAEDTVRFEAHTKGAARVRRGEGLWWADGSAYFTATTGGRAAAGQIFRYTPDATGDGGVLELLAESPDRSVLDMPDNLTLAPGGEVFVAEDGSGRNRIRVVRPDGTIGDFARNAVSHSEFAGLCFSPDGRTLFLNIQEDGLTLAVRGPFERGRSKRRQRRTNG